VAEPQVISAKTEQVPVTWLADAPPLNICHDMDVWKHLLASLRIMSFCYSMGDVFKDFDLFKLKCSILIMALK
jgi:hypothetical protein